MNKIARYTALILMALPTFAVAQGEPDDIALANDQFQEFFYESLTQKGIENYDKAVSALEKCLALQPANAAVYFELGKNYLAQRDYKRSYDSFERASQLDPTNMWPLVGMYDVCYETRDFDQAIVIVTKLITFKSDYKEDLTSLYMNTLQFDKALALINELNDTVGNSDLRDNYKEAILRDPKYQGSERENLLEQIAKNPKQESNYVALIFLYSESGQEDKALDVARRLEKEIPASEWAQVSLFKSYIAANEGAKAVKSMNIVLASTKIDNKIRHRILNEFLIYARNKPEHEADLQKAISYFDNDPEVDVAKEIGKFFHNKKEWSKTVKYYEQHLRSNSDDLETLFLLFEAYSESQQYDLLSKRAEGLIDSFPLQPQFYYYAGLAHNQLKNYKKAKDILEMGVDYLVDDIQLEVNFNIQLGEASNGLGDNAKKEQYFQKAEKLMQQKKK